MGEFFFYIERLSLKSSKSLLVLSLGYHAWREIGALDVVETSSEKVKGQVAQDTFLLGGGFLFPLNPSLEGY